MSETEAEKRLLEPYRVIDLTDARGAFAGTMLARLGAEVVMVEPPSGGPGRCEPPFVGDEAGSERSLWHLGFGRGKESVSFDWTGAPGEGTLHSLLEGADVVLMSGSPSEHRARSLPTPSELLNDHPHLVIGSVSGFGLSGPKADWVDGDLIAGAAGYTLSTTGNWDRSPLRTAIPQVYLNASLDLAVGVLIALTERGNSGSGQIVDVSAQESWIWSAGHSVYTTAWGEPEGKRGGGPPSDDRYRIRFTYPANDGYVTITVLFGAAIGPYTHRFVEWMKEAGECPEDVASIDWAKFRAGRNPAMYTRLQETIERFTEKRSREELFEEGRRRRLLIAPILKVPDVLESPQFEARSAFENISIDSLSIAVPGEFLRADPPLPRLTPAPILGGEPATLAEHVACLPETSAEERPPFDGLRVIDLTTSFAGPAIGRALAAYGATVVKVESARRPDTARATAPFRGETFDASLTYANLNAGKLSLAMDITDPQGHEVLKDLLKWGDVLVDSSTPGSLARKGLSDEVLGEINSSLIVLHTSMLGQTGPLASMPGYGNMGTALSGFVYTTSWPDAEPVGPSYAYTDWTTPRFALAAIIAAVDYRRRTGKRTVLDLGQAEAVLQLLTVGLLDLQANGRSWQQRGNRDYFMAPHGVYPTSGEDQWIAISCSSDEQWKQLADELGLESLAAFDLRERLERIDEIEERIAERTSSQNAQDLAESLQRRRVGAHHVQGSLDCFADPQIISRGGLTAPAVHASLGEVPIAVPQYRLSRTVPNVTRAAPTFGEHSLLVLGEFLGYTDERISELVIAGLLD